MKRFSVFALLLLGAIFTLSAQEDYKDAELYFQPEQMPDMKQFLPGPPAEDSQAFKYDLAVYELGSLARTDCEKFMGTRVFLTTWVKHKENWRDNDFLVRNFGYRE